MLIRGLLARRPTEPPEKREHKKNGGEKGETRVPSVVWKMEAPAQPQASRRSMNPIGALSSGPGGRNRMKLSGLE